MPRFPPESQPGGRNAAELASSPGAGERGTDERMSDELQRQAHLLLGIDIGGTKTVVVLARATGEILAESRLEDWTSGSWEKDVSTLASHAKVLMRGSGVESSQLHAVGLSTPGPLNPVSGIVIDAPNLPGWKDVPLVESLYREFGV